MLWLHYVMITTMATYGRTLCGTKRNTTPNTGGCLLSGQRHTTPNTGGVFTVRAIQHTIDVTGVQRLRGMPLGMVGACSGPSGTPPAAPVAPGRCPRTVPPNTGRGVVPLAREGPTARFRHNCGTYWKQSNLVFTRRGCERF